MFNIEKKNKLCQNIIVDTQDYMRRDNLMKKTIIIIMAICLILLTACGATGKVSKAKGLMEKEQWQEAVNVLIEIEENEEAEALLDECQMHVYSDYQFLKDLEESILERMEKANSDEYYALELIKIELAHLEQYRNAEFYNFDIEEQKNKYLHGLDDQKESYSKQTDFEWYLLIQDGYISRLEALDYLYNTYDFCKDNAEFVANYIMELEPAKKELEAFNEIEADITEQINTGNFEVSYDGYTIVLTLKNNTPYSFDGYIKERFYSNDIFVGDSTSYVEKVAPNSKYVHTFYLPQGKGEINNDQTETYEYNIYFYD